MVRAGLLGRSGAAVLGALAAAGCAWLPKVRPAPSDIVLELPSFSVRLAAGTGWTISRDLTESGPSFVLTRAGADGWDRQVTVAEVESSPRSLDELRRATSDAARGALGDSPSSVEQVAPPPAPAPGEGPLQVWIHATEDRSPALVAHRTADAAVAYFGGPAGGGCIVTLVARGRGDSTRAELAREWQELLDGVRRRPPDVDGAGAVAAQARLFPKLLVPGLAARSLTLPGEALGLALAGRRTLAPGKVEGAWNVGLGITDRLELDLPGYARWSFGEPEALTAPEWAVGAGWTGYEHDALRGSVWSGGVGFQARRRVLRSLAWRTSMWVEAVHESRTGRDRLEHAAVAGWVWDPHRRVSFAIELGEASRTRLGPVEGAAWLGGLATPLITLHLPPCSAGLAFGATWDGAGTGLVAGLRAGCIL